MKNKKGVIELTLGTILVIVMAFLVMLILLIVYFPREIPKEITVFKDECKSYLKENPECLSVYDICSMEKPLIGGGICYYTSSSFERTCERIQTNEIKIPDVSWLYENCECTISCNKNICSLDPNNVMENCEEFLCGGYYYVTVK